MKLKELEYKIDSIYNQIDNSFDKIMHSSEKGLDAFFSILSKTVDLTMNNVEKTLKGFHDIVQSNAKLLRHLGLPWTIAIPKVWLWYKNRSSDILPTDKEGIHFFRAPVGGGKSLTSFVLAERTLALYGHPSYFTSPVEKPQLDEEGEYYYVMHKVINLDDHYVKGKKVKDFDYEKYPHVYKDERHLRYNPRMNKTKEYNEKWLIEHNDELLMRHDGAKTINKFSQHMKLDSQEMETATYMHEIEAKKGLPWKQWLKDGLLRVYPYVIHFKTYKIDFTFEGIPERKLVKKWKLPVPMEVLERYDTHAEKQLKVEDKIK